MDTVNVTVMDLSPPEANAGPDQTVDEGTEVTLNGNASRDNDIILKWAWTFIDIEPVSFFTEKATYRFVNPGIFTVTLDVTDPAGHSDTDIVNITVNDLTDPIADAGPDMVVDEDTVIRLDGTGSSDNGEILNWTWKLNDGQEIALYGSEPTYIFNEPGQFVVTLNITDRGGNWDSDTVVVTVIDTTSPRAEAGPDQTVDEDTKVVSMEVEVSTTWK